MFWCTLGGWFFAGLAMAMLLNSGPVAALVAFVMSGCFFYLARVYDEE